MVRNTVLLIKQQRQQFMKKQTISLNGVVNYWCGHNQWLHKDWRLKLSRKPKATSHAYSYSIAFKMDEYAVLYRCQQRHCSCVQSSSKQNRISRWVNKVLRDENNYDLSHNLLQFLLLLLKPCCTSGRDWLQSIC